MECVRPNHLGPSKQSTFYSKRGRQKESQRYLKHGNNSIGSCHLKDGGGHVKQPQGAASNPQLTASKEMGISGLQPLELDFANNLEDFESIFFPRAFR